MALSTNQSPISGAIQFYDSDRDPQLRATPGGFESFGGWSLDASTRIATDPEGREWQFVQQDLRDTDVGSLAVGAFLYADPTEIDRALKVDVPWDEWSPPPAPRWLDWIRDIWDAAWAILRQRCLDAADGDTDRARLMLEEHQRELYRSLCDALGWDGIERANRSEFVDGTATSMEIYRRWGTSVAERLPL